MDQLTIRELVEIANQAGVLKRMGEEHVNRVVVDYVPSHPGMAIPRETGDDAPLEPLAPHVTTITYTLEDAMFGGMIYTTIVCGNRAILTPFVWQGYENLTRVTISPPSH